jgi:hypothetical protein
LDILIASLSKNIGHMEMAARLGVPRAFIFTIKMKDGKQRTNPVLRACGCS